MDDWISPPPFRPADALVQLKRSLRDLRPLAERGDGFELRGVPVIEFSIDEKSITARLARRPSRTPEWSSLVLKSASDLRKCADEVKKRVALWTEE